MSDFSKSDIFFGDNPGLTILWHMQFPKQGISTERFDGWNRLIAIGKLFIIIGQMLLIQKEIHFLIHYSEDYL